MEASDMDEDFTDNNSGIFTQEDSHSVAGEGNYGNKLDSNDKVESGSNEKTEINNSDDANANDDNNHQGDDGESSVDSFSTSQSGSTLSSMGSSSSEASLTLMQRQARNIARNERFLGSLREKYKDQLGDSLETNVEAKSKGTEKSESPSDDEESYSYIQENLGMVRKDTHRLFQFSLPKELSEVKDTKDEKAAHNNNGPLTQSCQTYASGLAALEQKYPHRRVPIGKLHSILSSTISLTASVPSKVVHSSAASVYVPAPIFCMGSKGTGKTSLVCDIVGLLSSHTSSLSSQSTKVQPAYVDCSIVEPSTVERLVYTIYKQLKPSSSGPMTTENRVKAKIRKKKRKRTIGKFRVPTKVPQKGEAKDENDENLTSTQPQHHKKETEQETNQQRTLPSRRAKKAAIHKSIANSASTYKKVHRKRTRENNDDIYENEEYDSDDDAVATLHSAVLSLGRSLQKHYGSYLDDNGAYRNRGFCKKPKCGILILDKAEELLSLSSASKRGTSSGASSSANNYLSELLLLPKIMKLNITIVVVTNYCTLHMARLNNASDPSKALGTISNGVHPIIVQFPAYKGNNVFTEILSTPENQKLVMGDSLLSKEPNGMRQSLKDKLVRSFWNTVVQFVSDSTRDIRDFQRLGRALWPSFVAPLHPSVLKETLMAASNKLGAGESGLTRQSLSDPEQYNKMEDEIVRILGNKFYPTVSTLASGNDSLTLLTLDESGSLPVVVSPLKGYSGGKIVKDTNLGVTVSVPQPYLRSCLLLAAFICQHNKADQDRKLFSIHGNGRRRKSKANYDIYGGNDEDLAFGSTSATQHSRGRKAKHQGQQLQQVEQLRYLKLRPVPLERVFSIFVTLVRLNPGYGGMEDENDESIINDLGSTRLYTDLSHLVDLGYLQVAKGNQPIHNAPSRILCTLTREEAVEISKRIGIPLERYLL